MAEAAKQQVRSTSMWDLQRRVTVRVFVSTVSHTARINMKLVKLPLCPFYLVKNDLGR